MGKNLYQVTKNKKDRTESKFVENITPVKKDYQKTKYSETSIITKIAPIL